MERIRLLAVLGMILMIPMMLYYPYEGLRWNLELSFLDMDKWTRNNIWVDGNAKIAMSTRIVFFTMWFLPLLIGWFGYLAAFFALNFLRRGILFDVRVARCLFWMGATTLASNLIALLAGALSPMVRSWHNPTGPLPMRIWYDSGMVGMAFCGLGYLLIGLVFAEAIKVARENEEFV